MNLDNKSKSALRTFHMAHNFLNEFGIHWLPVDPYEIINTQKNWYLKYADTLAYEIGHIYLGHLDNKRTKITSDLLDRTEYDQLEFEADIFAGEVLASKWIMRTLDIVDENDIALICGISDDAALSRYKKATEEYNFIPANVVLTLHNFEAYLKNITICRSLEDLDSFARFAYQNPEQNKLSKPKPKFLRNENSCPYCGNEIGVTKESCFCIACGSKLKSSAIKGIENCSHVNHQRAAFCESCGNPVYRIKQGFSLEECEI